MSKIYCADVGCIYNNDKGVCTAKKVAMSWHSVMTLWEGRQEFNRCKTRQTSKEQHELEKRMEEYMREQTGKVQAGGIQRPDDAVR